MSQRKRETQRKNTTRKSEPSEPRKARQRSTAKPGPKSRGPRTTGKKEAAENQERKPFKFTRTKGKEKELTWESRDKKFRKEKPVEPAKRKYTDKSQVRLNRYISNAGICSRREADVLIKAGAVKVNGKVVTEMGVKVGPEDVVHYGDQKLSREKLVYVLLNKPKDFVTTTRDPQGRRTVMQLVKSACKERIVPVGRLDRQTTGLLMLTNDGELAKKLTHPKHGVAKLYHVEVNKKISKGDLNKLLKGIELEDGFARADKAAYAGESEREIGLEIHMGKNRIVRRMMEALGYRVLKLDRVMFAGLTKKNLPRGKFRFLTETEVNQLKMR